MNLLQRDDATQRWRSSEFTDEVSLAGGMARLVLSEHGAVLVCTPEVHALVGGRPALAIALVAENEFIVGVERFRLRASPVPATRIFEGDGRATVCARCKTGIRPGDAVVECSCKALLHEGPRAGGGEPLLCSSYADLCPCGKSAPKVEDDD